MTLSDESGRPLKVLVISHGLDVGGIERSLIGLLDAIDYGRYQVDLVLFNHAGEFMELLNPLARLLPPDVILQNLKTPVSKVFRAGLSRLALLRLAAKARASISRFRKRPTSQFAYASRWANALVPDVLGSYDVAISFQAPHDFALRHVDARLKVGWVHTDYSVYQPDTDFELATWERLDRIAAVSDAVEGTFAQVYPTLQDKLMVVENVIDPSAVRWLAEQHVSDLPSERPDGALTLCTVGRYSHEKAFDVAIDACAELVKRRVQVRWLAIGYGPEHESLARKVKALGLENEFFLLGKRTNPYPYMAACDIYVQPSRYEGKAVTVREAQILAKPVLITNFPTAPSQLIDGVDGIICGNSAEEVADAIVRLAGDHDLRTHLTQITAKSDYSNRASVDAMFSTFRQLLERS